MKGEFWKEAWAKRRTGFHAERPNAFLVEHWSALELHEGARVFVPLCGKSLDLHWLHGKGYHVIGAELVEQAVVELFTEMHLTPDVTTHGELRLHSAERMDILVGDVFAVEAEHVGRVDAVYDRAALVALPPGMRERYVPHILDLTEQAPQLLVVFEFGGDELGGPPFGISEAEVRQRYGGFEIREVGRVAVDMARHPAHSVARLLKC